MLLSVSNQHAKSSKIFNICSYQMEGADSKSDIRSYQWCCYQSAISMQNLKKFLTSILIKSILLNPNLTMNLIIHADVSQQSAESTYFCHLFSSNYFRWIWIWPSLRPVMLLSVSISVKRFENHLNNLSEQIDITDFKSSQISLMFNLLYYNVST